MVVLASGKEFRVQDQVLEKLETFKYLDRKLYFDNINWPMVAWNLQRERRKWGRLSWLLCLKGGLHTNLWEVLRGGGSVCADPRIRFAGLLPPTL